MSKIELLFRLIAGAMEEGEKRLLFVRMQSEYSRLCKAQNVNTTNSIYALSVCLSVCLSFAKDKNSTETARRFAADRCGELAASDSDEAALLLQKVSFARSNLTVRYIVCLLTCFSNIFSCPTYCLLTNMMCAWVRALPLAPWRDRSRRVRVESRCLCVCVYSDCILLTHCFIVFLCCCH